MGMELFCILTIINVSVVFVLLCDRFPRCYHWGNRVKATESSVLFLVTTCEFTFVSQ